MTNRFFKLVIYTIIFFFVIMTALLVVAYYKANQTSFAYTLENQIDDNSSDGLLAYESVKLASFTQGSSNFVNENHSLTLNRLKTFDEVYQYAGLIELKQVNSDFVIDLKNATTNNITGRVQYEYDLCLINIDTAKALIKAQELAAADGYTLKIWDAYRPLSVQAAMNKSLPADKKHFVPAPSNSSQHARGIAIDVTLVDKNGNELDMPTNYCEFNEATYPNYTGATKIQTQNREYLKSIMFKAGFKVLSVEWWHYYLPTYQNYELLDISFGEYLQHREAAENL